MITWLCILGFSTLTGVFCGVKFNEFKAVLLGATLSWMGILVWLLLCEYLLPDQGGGASMWPIALAIAGTAAAVTGGLAAFFTSLIKASRAE